MPLTATTGVFAFRNADSTGVQILGKYFTNTVYHIELDADYVAGTATALINGVASRFSPYALRAGTGPGGLTSEIFVYLNGASGEDVHNSFTIGEPGAVSVPLPSTVSMGLVGSGHALGRGQGPSPSPNWRECLNEMIVRRTLEGPAMCGAFFFWTSFRSGKGRLWGRQKRTRGEFLLTFCRQITYDILIRKKRPQSAPQISPGSPCMRGKSPPSRPVLIGRRSRAGLGKSELGNVAKRLGGCQGKS